MTAEGGRGTIVTVGETMALARATETGSFRHVTDLKLSIGGAESNVAVGLSRLGIPAAWSGRVGADSLGERIVRELLGERVDVRAAVDTAAPTGLMVKESPTADTTAVHYYRAGSAGSRLSMEDVERLPWESAALLHVTGITVALSASARAAVFAAMARAAELDVPVSFDVNHRSRLWSGGDYQAVYRDMAARSTILFAGVDEAELVGGAVETAPNLERALVELAERIRDLGPRIVVIKRGEHGAGSLDEHGWQSVPARRVRAVDTVGAGDAFVAGWLSAWYRNATPLERLRVGAQAGAFACLNHGDWEGSPTSADLLRFAADTDPVAR